MSTVAIFFDILLTLLLVGHLILSIASLQRLEKIRNERERLWKVINGMATEMVRYKGFVDGLYDKYAKLYTRVTDLEKTDEVHSGNPR